MESIIFILIFYVVLPFCIWMCLRCGIQGCLLPDHESSQYSNDKSKPEKCPSKIANFLRFLFCLPRKNNQQACESCGISGDGFCSGALAVERFVMNVVKKILNGFRKIVLGFKFGDFSFCHSNGKISEPNAKVRGGGTASSVPPCSVPSCDNCGDPATFRASHNEAGCVRVCAKCLSAYRGDHSQVCQIAPNDQGEARR